MSYPFLLFLLLVHGVHAVIFFKHYRKTRKFHYLMLTTGFILLTGYYLSKTLRIETTTLLVVVRWTGITLASIGGVILLKIQLKALKTWLMMNPTTMMLFLRIILAYVKFKDKVNMLFNNKEGDKLIMSKMPMYIMVTLLSAILAFAWNGMLGSRKPDMAVQGDMRVVYSHAKEEDVGHPYRFFVTASSRTSQVPKDGVKVYWLDGEAFKAKHPNLQKTDFNLAAMSATEKGGFYAHSFPSREKTQRYYFFIEVTDSQNNVIILPEKVFESKTFYRVTYKQDPHKWGLLVHIALMIIALFFLLHGLYYAFNYLWNKTEWNIGKAVSAIFWGVVTYGISGFPLGFWMAYEKFGIAWGGFPLGNDVTDNKTLFNFVYWAILLVLMKGTLLRGNHQKNIISHRVFAWLAILGGILTMVVRFMIPHGDI